MRIAEIITESEKRLGPDMNDPYEQGWYARPGYDFNPYERGTEQYNKWEDGHEERNAQPNHYDESVEEDKDPCWKNYKQVGTKEKDGRTVPNCVPRESVEEGSMAAAALKEGDFVKDRTGKIYRVFAVNDTVLRVAPYHGEDSYGGMGTIHTTKVTRVDSPVEEGSMAAAAHNPDGPKFGGYYGATQKGAPKPGQGFGGAAESVGVELDEVAPPGMEDTVLKLKKQYPGEPQKAYATAWSMYNKQKGKK